MGGEDLLTTHLARLDLGPSESDESSARFAELGIASLVAVLAQGVPNLLPGEPGAVSGTDLNRQSPQQPGAEVGCTPNADEFQNESPQLIRKLS